MKMLIGRYAQERCFTVNVRTFCNGVEFLEGYRPVYDIVFMDIEMPLLDGMATAQRLREVDERVGLIFITQMAQYAIKGYEVAALDYLLKPVSYGTLADKIDQALTRIDRQSVMDTYIFLSLGTDSYRRLRLDDVIYVVKDRNYLLYVTKDGNFRIRGALRDAEAQFAGSTVVKCASGCLVNLRYIEQKLRNTIYINGMQFTITKPYQQDFTERFMQFLRCGT